MSITNDNILVGMDELAPLIIESIENNCEVKITIKGNSMFPLLRHGRDRVKLNSVTDVKKYDIVLYRRDNGKYILHRIVKMNGDTLGIAGDNEQQIEYPIYKSQIIAIVTGFWRKGKYYECDSMLHKIYSRIWLMILPKRRKALRILRKANKIRRRLGL